MPEQLTPPATPGTPVPHNPTVPAAAPGTEWVVVMHKRFMFLSDDYVVGRYVTEAEADTVFKKLSLIAPWGSSYSVERRIKGS